uniref:Osiris 9 n=1 Tax=Cacopsylla melanoneura TaxID=428564 RepID=A0A8D8QMB1_9HEMI
MWKQTAVLLLGAFVCSVVCAPEPVLAEPKPADDGTQFDSQMAECIDKDSISCAQIQMYRQVRSFANADSIDLFAGLTLVKNPSAEKSGRALTEQLEENEILNSSDADKRESALESFTYNKAANFFQERSLQWNLKPVVTEVVSAARGMIDSVPSDLKSKVSEFVEEGRGKKKKLIKQLIPFIIGLKLKLKLFAVLAYFVIALIAKKAILASLISLAISGFIAIKKLSSQHHHEPHHEVVEHHAHSAGYEHHPAPSYSSGGWDSYGGGHDAHGAYSNQVAHSVAYNGQKPVRR